MRLPRLASLLAFRPPSREDTSNQRHSSLSIAPDHTSRPSPRSSNHISPTALLHAHTHIFPTSRIDPIIMADDKFYRLLGVSKVRLAFVSPGRQVVFPSPSLALSTELSLVSSTMLRMLPMTRLRRLTRRPYVPGLCFAPPPPPPPPLAFDDDDARPADVFRLLPSVFPPSLRLASPRSRLLLLATSFLPSLFRSNRLSSTTRTVTRPTQMRRPRSSRRSQRLLTSSLTA